MRSKIGRNITFISVGAVVLGLLGARLFAPQLTNGQDQARVGQEPTLSRLQPGEWPQWRGPERDGRSLDVGLLKSWPAGGPKLLWRATGIGAGFSSVAVAGGTVYITGDVGNALLLTALDMSGNRKWQVKHGPAWTQDPPGARGSPVVSDGRLYLLSGHGLLKCYDARSGAEKWQVHLVQAFGGRQEGWGYAESPLVYKNMLIVTPGGDNCIVALNKETGETLWTSAGLTDAAHHSSCIVVEFQGHPMVVQMVAKAWSLLTLITVSFSGDASAQ